MIIGNVTTTQRRNADRSRTFYAVWHVPTDDGQKQKRKRLFKSEPKPTASSLRTWSRKAAQAAADLQQRIEQDEDEQCQEIRFRPRALNHALLDYLQSQRASDLSPSTVDARDRMLTSFLDHVGRSSPKTRCVHQLSSRHINGDPAKGYVGYRLEREREGVLPSTIALELRVIRQWLAWCLDQGHIRQPVRFKIPKPGPVRRSRIIDPELIRRVIALQPTPDRTLAFRILACTGMRQGELRVCRTDSWDTEARTLTIPKTGPETTKLHHRSFPVGWRLEEGLDRHVRTPHTTEYLFEHNSKPLVRHINHWMEGFNATPKELRRWFQYQMEKLGCPPGWIDDLMGHTPAGVRAHYTPGTTDDFRKYMQDLEDVLNES